ncbi:small metal-binding protein SmbP [Methylocaldum sp.]|uniref:small metal-binding protein SmbP n=1 Tax=Methylocaldum sp. TaxID=1969727 RepID=UPI002D5FD071|nr:small metal-binding protein SmbP [Methylocaldum sp.]HYE34758.1 small metal-binding protein SmbP [Methylocaldum sp.]
MKRIIIAVSLVTTLALTGLGFAQMEANYVKHVREARQHVTIAVTQGEKGDAKALVQHAQTGLEHVRMAQKAKSLPDLDKAAKSLEDAINQGQTGDANKATEQAKESVEYLDAVLSGLGG